MGGSLTMNGADGNVYEFWSENLKERNQSEDLSVDGY
jgi:hypothetical protein